MASTHGTHLAVIAAVILGLTVSGLSVPRAGYAQGRSDNAVVQANSEKFIPFGAFLQGVREARFMDYAGREDVKVRDKTAFEEMRAHVLRMYEGVRQTHTFVSGGQYFDCITVDS